MRAQILSIGSELLAGHLTDTNSTWLAQQLALLDIELVLVTHVGDDLPRIAATIRRAMDDADLVVCTGGVGPTEDDLTREAIADVFGETPVVDEAAVATIRAFFRGRGLDMPERNAKQAWLIASSEALANPVGTAPGWLARRDGKMVVAMPGVPREMFRMWTEQVVPRIVGGQRDRVARSTTLKTIGIGESLVEERLHHLVSRGQPVVATYAKDDGVHIRVTAVASNADDASAAREMTVAEIHEEIGEHIYGRDDQTLPGQLIAALVDQGLLVAIAEAGTGGRFGSLLMSRPEAGQVFAYSTVTAEGSADAEELARGARAADDDLLGVGVAMRVAPRDNAVFAGTVEVAVVGDRSVTRSFPMRSGYEDIQRRSALFAAETLFGYLRDGPSA